MSKEIFFVCYMVMHCINLLEGKGKKLWTIPGICVAVYWIWVPDPLLLCQHLLNPTFLHFRSKKIDYS